MTHLAGAAFDGSRFLRSLRRCAAPLFFVAMATASCSGSNDATTGSDGGTQDAADAGKRDAAPAACNPLTPPAITLAKILGVGEGDASTLYVADDVPDGGDNRVFVSSGSTLYRQFLAGEGYTAVTGGFDDGFDFQKDGTDDKDARTLFVNVVDDEPVLMALGPTGEAAYGGPDAGDVSLTLVDAGVLSQFKVQNLPFVIGYVADIGTGDSLVITEVAGYAAASDTRVFYGKESHMIEYPVLDSGGDCCATIIDFSVNGTRYEASFASTSAGPDESSRLLAGSTTYSLKLRTPTPKTLEGFAFTCLSGVP